MTIKDQALRTYRGTELAAEIIRTIEAARGQLNEAALEGYRSVLGPDFDPAALSTGIGGMETVIKEVSQHLFGR